MKITEEARKYVAEHGISDAQTVQFGMEEKRREFDLTGAEIYPKAGEKK